jgi:hypothetical protein
MNSFELGYIVGGIVKAAAEQPNLLQGTIQDFRNTAPYQMGKQLLSKIPNPAAFAANAGTAYEQGTGLMGGLRRYMDSMNSVGKGIKGVAKDIGSDASIIGGNIGNRFKRDLKAFTG